jgi:hypothetical protein
MPSLRNHQSSSFTKVLTIGDSKGGKTGSLCSLVKAGYKLRILDLDNGLDVLFSFVNKECPEKIDNVEYRTILRDERNLLGVAIKPKAFTESLKMLAHWKYDETDLGEPKLWGPDCILIIDSLSALSDACWDWRESLLVAGAKDGKYDQRAIYKDAQDSIENVMALLTSDSFRTNVIVISHPIYIENPDKTKRGYPNTVGSKLGPIIPRYFNNLFRYTNNGKERVIETESTSPMFDLANAKPFTLPKEVPIATGLATIFSHLREKEASSNTSVESATNTTRPASLVRRRI